ncbi:MAG: hypothetical protein ABIW80_07705, partial [Lapillicoccus sp.]
PAATAATAVGDAASAADLPLAYVCTTATRAMFTRAVVLVRVRGRATLALLGVDLFIVAAVALTRAPRPWSLLVLMVVAHLALVGLEVLWPGADSAAARGRVRSCGPRCAVTPSSWPTPPAW